MCLAVVVAMLLAGACTGDSEQQEILVFAASSLTDAFTELGAAFEASNEGAVVTFNFASSSTLATQIVEGAPADVFASANEAQLQRAVDTGRAEEPTMFATNSLVVIVPRSGSPVQSYDDLATAGVKLVLAAPEVPVGAYARDFITSVDSTNPGFSAAVLANIVSNEPNVRSVLTKVQLGEADAGVVYETDAAIEGEDVRVLDVPGEFNVIARYPVAVIADSTRTELSERFVEFVVSPQGQSILESFGFGPAPADTADTP